MTRENLLNIIERRDRVARRVCLLEGIAPLVVAFLVVLWFLCGASLLAQSQERGGGPTGVPGVDQVARSAEWLGNQQISVWFALVTILFFFGIFMVLKWLLAQYSEQRIANSQLVNQLIEYLRTDHQAVIVLQNQSNVIMTSVLKFLERTEPILNRAVGVTHG